MITEGLQIIIIAIRVKVFTITKIGGAKITIIITTVEIITTTMTAEIENRAVHRSKYAIQISVKFMI
jgi:hypothetical protein